MARINEAAFYQEVGRRLKARRKIVGVTQEAITSPIGMERTTLAHIESGRQKPSLYQFFQLCRELHVEPQEMLPTWSDIQRTSEAPNTAPANVKVVGETTLTPSLSAFLTAEDKETMDEQTS